MRQLIYPVPPVEVGAAPPPLEEVSLPVAAAGDVVAWRYRAAEVERRRPAILFFHGNGENLETLRWGGVFDRLLALRSPFLVIDYPGYGRSPGRPSEASLKAAAETALRWHLARSPEGPTVACGWSLGAALAVHLAAAAPTDVAGLVALSPWTSLREVAANHFPGWLVGLGLREEYESLAVAPRVACPSLVVHGERDRVISASQGERLARALPAGEWVPLPGVGHNDLLGTAAAWRQIEEFVASLGGGRSL